MQRLHRWDATALADEMIEYKAHTSVQDLTRLKHQGQGFSFLPKQPIHSLLAGQKASRLRGRGLNFEEIRN